MRNGGRDLEIARFTRERWLILYGAQDVCEMVVSKWCGWKPIALRMWLFLVRYRLRVVPLLSQPSKSSSMTFVWPLLQAERTVQRGDEAFRWEGERTAGLPGIVCGGQPSSPSIRCHLHKSSIKGFRTVVVISALRSARAFC